MKAKKIYTEAQQCAIGYYAKESFEVVSEPFMEESIPHVKMERTLDYDRDRSNQRQAFCQELQTGQD